MSKKRWRERDKKFIKYDTRYVYWWSECFCLVLLLYVYVMLAVTGRPILGVSVLNSI